MHVCIITLVTAFTFIKHLSNIMPLKKSSPSHFELLEKWCKIT